MAFRVGSRRTRTGGSPVDKKEALKKGDMEDIKRTAAAFMAKVRNVRG